MSKIIKTQEDRQRLLNALQGERNQALYFVGTNTGMAPGEFSELSYKEYLDKYTYRDCDYLRHFDHNNLNLPLFHQTHDPKIPLTLRSINRIIKQASKESGLDLKYKVTTETLRKIYYYRLFITGTTLQDVSLLLNHPSLHRTEIYLELDERDHAIHMQNYSQLLLKKLEGEKNG